MLKKRIIPCLDIKNGRVVKGTSFQLLKDLGNPIELAKKYEEEGADELVFLDIAATEEGRHATLHLVTLLAKELSIPFTVGGGINDLYTARNLIKMGADKISINSAAVNNPDLIKTISQTLGKQCTVVAIDYAEVNGFQRVFIHGGKQMTHYTLEEFIDLAIEKGAGELLLTSIEADGSKKGFDLPHLQKIAEYCPIPIIASGGAGEIAQFYSLFTHTKVSGALAAGIFHRNELSIPFLKSYLKNQSIPIR